MNFLNKKVLVIGIGVSGISACKLLREVSADVTISDSKNIENINFDLTHLRKIGKGVMV